MGCVSFGAPRAIVQEFRQAFGLDTFVETGTHMGGTSAWASGVFARVITIEASEGFHRVARERHQALTNVEFLLGDSRTRLAETVARLTSPALFWLDAHWMGGTPLPGTEVFGAKAECPVLQEIEIINSSPLGHFILIDDARFFLAPPPLPHRASEWPDCGAVLARLGSPTPRYTVIYEDVITSVPQACQPQVQAIYQKIITTKEYADAGRGRLWRKVRRRVKALLPRRA